ncbi:MAG: HU family DNA-binding protein [Anaerolineae bacterium]|nr:HU family DNA-binding protein [Anaerolineae bacterium]
MRKRELVELAARRSSLTRRQMNEAVDAIFAAIAEALAGGEPVILRGFGRFSTWRRRQRIRDFEGASHQVDGVQIRFNASAALRRRLKEEA